MGKAYNNYASYGVAASLHASRCPRRYLGDNHMTNWDYEPDFPLIVLLIILVIIAVLLGIFGWLNYLEENIMGILLLALFSEPYV